MFLLALGALFGLRNARLAKIVCGDRDQGVRPYHEVLRDGARNQCAEVLRRHSQQEVYSLPYFYLQSTDHFLGIKSQ
jgi:hypothetical protein